MGLVEDMVLGEDHELVSRVDIYAHVQWNPPSNK
jgi:hypothetical protein